MGGFTEMTSGENSWGGKAAAARDAHRAGDNATALALIAQALEQTDAAEAWDLKGDILLALSQYSDAVDAYSRAIEGEPGHAGYLHDLGRSLLQIGRAAEAASVLKRAATLMPGAWDILCDLGAAQLEQGAANDALASFSESLAARPDSGLVYFNQGNALQELNRFDEAELSYRSALRFTPSHLPALISLATLVSDRGQIGEAEKLLAEARVLGPHEALLDQAEALVKLRYGLLHEGFTTYESRFRPSRYGLHRRPFACPQWQGEDLAGRDILIWTEQGLGEEILAASMFAEIIGAARSCTIECSDRTAPLFQRSFKGARIVARREPPDPVTLGRFDYQIAALSLGTHLRPDFTAFRKHAGYLRTDENLRSRLHQKYRAGDPTARVVGISWDSTARHGGRKRLPLEAWGPILAIPGIRFVSLQYGVGPDDPGVNRLGLGSRLVMDGEINALNNLDASAAQVAAMDLVITVSNTTAHLAGATGAPVWTLLADGPGCFWYWFRNRNDSPWYPSMRTIRQPSPGDWPAVVGHVAGALVEMAGQSGL